MNCFLNMIFGSIIVNNELDIFTQDQSTTTNTRNIKLAIAEDWSKIGYDIQSGFNKLDQYKTTQPKGEYAIKYKK